MLADATAMDLATRILVVDDDPGIRTLMSDFLRRHGYAVDTAASASEMRARLQGGGHDLIVLDVMMPGEDGLSALHRLQREGGPPVIMLSAVGSDVDRIVGLEMGADDYLPKPCNPRELLARIRVVLRRREEGQPPATSAPAPVEAPHVAPRGTILRFAGWTFDTLQRLLHDPEDVVINLSDSEFRLLKAMAERPRRVLTRDQLLDYAHSEDANTYDRAIDVQISRLRRKLNVGEKGGELIRTVRNEGYMFVPAVTRE